MPYSMTGFVSVKKSFEDCDVDVKVKSLNGKFLEVSLKGDRSVVTFLDIEIKKLSQQFFERGTLSIVVNITSKKPTLSIEKERLKAYIDTLRETLKDVGLNLSDDKILDYALSLNSNSSEELDQALRDNILSTLSGAFHLLREERRKEGEVLISDIRERLEDVEEKLSIIEQQKEGIIKSLQEKMEQRVKQLLGESFSERAFIEASLIVQKLDITEEIVRLKSHIDSFRELLGIDRPVGRKMDFLCQEMHREINTLGNKIPDLSSLTVEIKTQIEKIRQQVQNIE
ncbi:MAG: YicC family protein [Hydrogenothermaceae bacterium]|nr:YicC family protein [Hydrogenothermaceae bacterium]